MEYGQTVWSPHLRKHIDLIEGVQRSATKFVDNLYRLSYEERLAHVNRLTLKFRREFGDIVQVYKHLHYYDQASIPSKIKRNKRPNRRHDFQLVRNFPDDGHDRGVQAN